MTSTATLPQVWTAAWITADNDPDTPTAAPLFRREWLLPAPIRTATVHLSGLATAIATVNGHPLDDTHLGPGLSDYSKAARAVSVEVSSRLAGQRQLVLAVELGRGFFDLPSPEVWCWSTAPWRDTPRLTAEVHLVLDDGTSQVLITDEHWRTGFGGTRFDSLYEGESFDQRLEPTDWRLPGFDDSAWSAAKVCRDHPMAGRTHPRFSRELATTGLPLREALAEPIRVIDTVQPTWTQLADGRWVGDVGMVIAGWVRVTPHPGDDPVEVSILHGEMLFDDGSVKADNLRFIPTGRFQRDHLVLTDQPWQAHHTWKGFRYLEVTGADPTATGPGGVRVEALRAAAAVPVTGSVTSANATIDWLDRAFRNTVLTNLHWVPTDTPTYEKNGWTGDALVALPAMLTRFDLRRMLISWLDDFLDAQLPSGSLPVIIPSAGWGYDNGECAPAPEWTTLYPILVDALEGEYGVELWPLHRDGVRRYLDYELARLDADGLAVGVLGDYLAPGFDGPPPEDVRFHSTIALIRGLRVAAAHLDDQAERYLAAAEQMADRLNSLFFDAEAGSYRAVPSSGSLAGQRDDPGYRQAIQVQALDAQLVPDDLVATIVDGLVKDLVSRENHHDVGCLGGARLCSLLVRHGHAELAVAVATNPTPPSWETWRLDGHSTLLEMWSEPVRSRAHYFMGAGIRFVEDDLIGLVRTGPGWSRFELRPQPVASIGRLELTRGPLVAGWSVDGGSRAEVWVTVPAGAEATVTLPDGQRHAVTAGEHRFLCEVPGLE